MVRKSSIHNEEEKVPWVRKTFLHSLKLRSHAWGHELGRPQGILVSSNIVHITQALTQEEGRHKLRNDHRNSGTCFVDHEILLYHLPHKRMNYSFHGLTSLPKSRVKFFSAFRISCCPPVSFWKWYAACSSH